MCRIEPIIMSAGELESEWAGAPGRLIRDRYRRAAEVAKVRGKLPCLMINDLDAGVGIQEGVQRTVRPSGHHTHQHPCPAAVSSGS